MKKIICICLAGALMSGLCACNNAVSVTSESVTEQTTMTEEQISQEETEEYTEQSAEVSEETDMLIDYEQMKAYAGSEIPVIYTDRSSEEIVEIVQAMRHISTASPVEDYLKRFTVKPVTSVDGQTRMLRWTYEPEEFDCFRQVLMNVREKDGKLLVDANGTLDIVMWFSDPETASGVYIRLVKILTDEFGKPDDDIRNGTTRQTVFGPYSVQMLEADGVHQVRVLISTVSVDMRG